MEPSGWQSDNNGAEHDRKSQEALRSVHPPGVPRAEVIKQESPEAFGQVPDRKVPDSFGRGKPSPQKADEKPQKKDDDEDKDSGKNGPEDKESGDDEESGKKDDPQKDDKPKKPPFYKRPLLMTILILAVLLIVTICLIVWLYSRQFETTDDAFIDGHVVQISPKVAEIVKAVHIDDNWHVKPGDVLIELDQRDYATALEQAKAAEASAQGKLSQAKTQLEVSKARIGEADAQVTVAQTNAENANRDYERYMSLDPRARSQQQLDNSTANHRGSDAQVRQAQANLAAAKAQVADSEQSIKTAEADVVKAHADTHKAELQLSYCTIIAPVEGIVTRKNVEPGQYVQIDQPMFSIVPTEVWVTANYKETQLDHMAVGQSVEISIDAFPDVKLHGKIDSIQNGTGQRFTLLPPENATGNYVKVVQRVPVKILIDAGDLLGANHLIAPGLSVTPKVRIR